MEALNKKLFNNRIFKIFVLVLITVVACIPLFFEGIEGHFGQDLMFHLNRIEGIVTELFAGHFPVRMESNWMDGYGYPVSIYYGDILLYIPALLRLMGIGVVSSYKCYVFLVTLATASVTYICFNKIFKRTDIALFCSFIYTLSSYRLVNVYIRAAVGEYTAFIFLPIIMLAMYNIYKSDKSIPLKRMFVNASLLMLGVTGLINTHMLSLEITGIVLIVFCLINFKKTFTKSVLLTFVISGVEIVIVNLFYIVPFVDYFVNENVNINNVVNNSRTIQNSGLFLWEYFSFFRMPFANIEAAGDDRLLVTPGIIFVIIIIAGVIMWILRKADKEMKITVVSVIILLFVTSRYFPWDFLSANTKIGDFLAQVQFPWRYMGIIILLTTLLGGRIIERFDKKSLVTISYTVALISCLVTVIWFSYEYKKYGELVTYETESDLDSSDMGFIEYLRVGTERERFTHRIETTGDVSVNETYRNGTDRDYHVTSHSLGGTVTLPIVNYRGYEIVDNNGNKSVIYDSDNKEISFYVSSDTDMDMYLRYVEPRYMRMAEIISLLGIIVIIIINIYIARKKEARE